MLIFPLCNFQRRIFSQQICKKRREEPCSAETSQNFEFLVLKRSLLDDFWIFRNFKNSVNRGKGDFLNLIAAFVTHFHSAFDIFYFAKIVEQLRKHILNSRQVRKRFARFNSLRCVMTNNLIANLTDSVEFLKPAFSLWDKPAIEDHAIIENCFQTSGIVFAISSCVTFWQVESAASFVQSFIKRELFRDTD